MSAPVVEIEHVDFDYQDLRVLEDVSLRVEAGEFLGIVGPNAGGKTTLLRLLLGELRPSRGRIRVLGRKPTEARELVGYVPQYPRFQRDFPITVRQVVLMGRLTSRSLLFRYSREDHRIAERVMRRVEIAEIAERPIGALSGGQTQRVLLARALVGEPRLLVLDEPTANIDQRRETDIFDLLRELNREMTIIVVSHDIGFISAYVGRVACLNRTLLCHTTSELDADTIQRMYGGHIHRVEHVHE